MNARRIDGFFYGLFMDAETLRQAGVKPSNFRRAYVDNFVLRIGQRATLLPSPGARAFGMLIALTHADLEHLYNAQGLSLYRPEAVVAQTFENGAVPGLCYNLVQPPEPDEWNPEYAKRLQSVLVQLGFPTEYVEDVALRPCI